MSLLEKKIAMESAYTLLQPYLSSGTGTQGMMDFKQLLDEVFVISGIIKVKVIAELSRVKRASGAPWVRK